ncbi:MAG: hypothetical protein HY827_03420 [Actinobacteria bacterium]|nr:hypothetical protein [Actinomycetota bacterium]
MADDKKPIQIGFRNGQTVGLKLEQAELDKLIAAIKAEESWHTVTEDTKSLTLRADRVDFYGTDEKPEARRAGF